MSAFAISREDVHAAEQRLQGKVIRTPCLFSERLSNELDCELYFKAESLQHIGAFKARGALNAILQLTSEQAEAGVVTHSSGNHAAALARAAAMCGIQAHVVMPKNAPANKIASVRSFGVEPIFCEATSDARAAAASEVQTRTGATFVHPYDYPPVMAGQGTVALEIEQQVADVDLVITPVGGGGLLSGILTVFAGSETQVYAAEPEWADDAYRSLQSGVIEPPLRFDTVADGLRTPLGKHTFPIIKAHVAEIVTVSESSIYQAMRTITESAKLVCEPSGAVGFAGLSTCRERFAGKRVVVVVTGGNLEFGACKLGSVPN